MNKKNEKFAHRINDDIRGYKEVRIVGEGIESKVVTLSEAKEIADSMELDLVEINTKTNPPILRICDYGKFLYELKKNAKKNKPIVHPLKEIQLSVNIADNDLNTKARHAMTFINEGSKVKVILTMRGRELTRRDENKKSLYEFIQLVEEVATPESLPKDEGNKTTVILTKKKQ